MQFSEFYSNTSLDFNGINTLKSHHTAVLDISLISKLVMRKKSLKKPSWRALTLVAPTRIWKVIPFQKKKPSELGFVFKKVRIYSTCCTLLSEHCILTPSHPLTGQEGWGDCERTQKEPEITYFVIQLVCKVVLGGDTIKKYQTAILQYIGHTFLVLNRTEPNGT